MGATDGVVATGKVCEATKAASRSEGVSKSLCGSCALPAHQGVVVRLGE
jgi:hypothetical protein